MFGNRLIKSNNAGAACTTDTVQILDGTPFESIATYQLDGAATSIPNNTYPGTFTNPAYAAGKFGQAAVFNGSSSQITYSQQVVPTGATSVSFWYNSSGTTQVNYLMGGGVNTASKGITVGYNGSTNQFFGIVAKGVASLAGVVVSSTYSNTGWYNIVFVWDGTTSTNAMKLYINGVLDGENTSDTSAASIGSYSSFNIGGVSGTYSQGSIDQVRIFNTALSAVAVTSLYNETVATASNSYINVPSCIAYYKMSDATDETGSYDGTPSNVNFNVAGKFGNAGSFNGSSSRITLPNGITSAMGVNDFSFSYWINLNSVDASLDDYHLSFRNDIYAVMFNNRVDRKLRFIVRSSGGAFTYPNTNYIVPLSEWINVTFVKSSTTGIEIFVNGVSKYTDSSYTGNISGNSQSNQIGAIDTNGIDAKIDQVRIFNRAITATEVETLYDEVQCIPTIVPTDNFNTVIYSGNNTAKTVSVGFAPDLVWIKNRNNSTNSTHDHSLFDSVRTTGYRVRSNSNGAENDYSSHMSGFTSGGFNLTTSGALNDGSGSGTYVAWNWKAGGAAVSNTDGTITSQVSANTDAGFSIVKYTGGNSASDTVGHGLTDAEMIILKDLTDGTNNWRVWHKDLTANYWMYLNLTLAQQNAATDGGIRNVDANTFGFINGTTDGVEGVNSNASDYIAYCFHSVDGYSKIGSYTGTGVAGNSIVTGFRPAFILIKNATDTGGANWVIIDNKRDDADAWLYANVSDAEFDDGNTYTQFNSIGFTVNLSASYVNTSGATYIFMAFAEEVFVPDNFFNDDSTVATYKLDGDAGDDSGNGYSGSVTNVTYATGKFDEAAVFNGSSRITSNDPTKNDTTFSISAWINVDNINTFNPIVTVYGSTAATRKYIFRTTNTNELQFIVYDESGVLTAIPTKSNALTAGTWYHVVAIANGGNFEIYLDGTSVATGTGSNANTDATADLIIGSRDDYAVGSSVNNFNGKIDQVRIFDRALDAGEVEQLYNE